VNPALNTAGSARIQTFAKLVSMDFNYKKWTCLDLALHSARKYAGTQKDFSTLVTMETLRMEMDVILVATFKVVGPVQEVLLLLVLFVLRLFQVDLF
jgi:hypothetical protein